MTTGAARRRARLGLRSRVTIAFAAGAAVLSGVLAGATYGLADHYLLDQRQSSALNQAFVNARLLKQDLTAPSTDVATALSSLTPAQGTRSLLYRDGRWFSTSITVGRSALPTDLVDAVRSGSVATQRIPIQGGPALAVGIPLPAVGADYFEVHSLSELARTLDVLGLVLLIAALVTTVGGAAVGRWASGRLVRPLTNVAEVAAAISQGDLGHRLPMPSDPELDRLVGSFNEMVDALQKRIERDARFASDVSHELRSPLTTVQASVEVLEVFRATLPRDGQRALGLLEAEIGRFSGMVQDLLEISRLDAGAGNLDLEELSLVELVAGTVAAHTGGQVPVQARLECDMAIRADRRRLQRVLVNLLDNARIHGGGAVAVVLEADGARARIMVDDAGPGIPPPERDRIFERFYRGPAAGRRADATGTGLGLALAQEHVRAHGGSITVHERPGGGARVVVDLPWGAG